MHKRYFEFVGGNSAKFWELGISGTEVTVRFGREGDGANHLDVEVRPRCTRMTFE